MEIVVASKEQLSIIQQLARDIWFEAYKNILSIEQIEFMLNQFYSYSSLENQFDANQVFLLFSFKNEYVGYASYELNFDNSNKTKLHKLYIMPKLQGKGFGKHAMNEVLSSAYKNNNLGVVLNVNKYNSALQFYSKIGFTIVDSVIIDIGNDYIMDDYVMETNF
jgi:GNAT superfamily N-acetyltransferase